MTHPTAPAAKQRVTPGGGIGAPHDTHDFRDYGADDLKRDPGRDWERDQQREYLPGVGR